MASNAPSDTESNMSGFVRYSDKDIKQLYTLVIENFEMINQDTMKLEQNLRNIVKQAGPLEGQLSALLHNLPKPNLNLPMETE